ncbi:Ig-like domain-containing protein [Desulfitobacterium sp. THU1]|uniref:Ig-like domain-containing protein n=1 Tax=Desulfitobacterium sp. THU1 TaxID=3138072 RepID=UPI00311E985A
MYKSFKLIRLIALLMVISLFLSGCYKPYQPYDPDEDDYDEHAPIIFLIDDEPYEKKNDDVISDKEVNKSYTVYVTIINNGGRAKNHTAKDVKLFLVDETRSITIEVGEKDITRDGYTTFSNLSYGEQARVHLAVEGTIKKQNKQYYVKARSNSFNIGDPTASTIESLSVTPISTTIKVGETVSYRATAKYKNRSSAVDVTDQVRWLSEVPSKATMTGNQAIGVGIGTTKIIASLEDKIAEATLVVMAPASLNRIEITPTGAEVLIGQDKPFYAYGIYANNQRINITSEVTWSSTATDIATIASSGVATGKGAGMTTIAATLQGKSASTSLTVKEPPVLIPDDQRLIWEKEVVN